VKGLKGRWVRGVLLDGDHTWGACMGGPEHRAADALSCAGITSSTQHEVPSSGQTLAEVERAPVLQVLRDTNGVIGGPHGSARLGVRRTSLIYRMEKLGIPRRPAWLYPDACRLFSSPAPAHRSPRCPAAPSLFTSSIDEISSFRQAPGHRPVWNGPCSQAGRQRLRSAGTAALALGAVIAALGPALSSMPIVSAALARRDLHAWWVLPIALVVLLTASVGREAHRSR
jgi:hypothetical protein